MPTSYTSFIEDGKITTGKEFLSLCCRQFGVCIGMREKPLLEPIAEKFEPDSIYEKKLQRAIIELEEARKLKIEDVIIIIQKQTMEREKSIKQQIVKDREIYDKYSKIRQDIEKWIPPTSDHISLKEFALEQIDLCLLDYNSGYYQKELEKLYHTAIAPAEYISMKITSCEKHLEIARKSYEDEIKRVNNRNLWLKEFRESFLKLDLEDKQESGAE